MRKLSAPRPATLRPPHDNTPRRANPPPPARQPSATSTTTLRPRQPSATHTPTLRDQHDSTPERGNPPPRTRRCSAASHPGRQATATHPRPRHRATTPLPPGSHATASITRTAFRAAETLRRAGGPAPKDHDTGVEAGVAACRRRPGGDVVPVSPPDPVHGRAGVSRGLKSWRLDAMPEETDPRRRRAPSGIATYA